MNQKLEIQVELDDKGRLVLPSGVVSRYKLKPGTRIFFEEGGNGASWRGGNGFPAATLWEM